MDELSAVSVSAVMSSYNPMDQMQHLKGVDHFSFAPFRKSFDELLETDLVDTSSIVHRKLTLRGPEKEERSKPNVIYKVERLGGTKLEKPGRLWLMESKKGARKY
nr:NAC domain-containing protein [Tanacetum cinerariifolium]